MEIEKFFIYVIYVFVILGIGEAWRLCVKIKYFKSLAYDLSFVHGEEGVMLERPTTGQSGKSGLAQCYSILHCSLDVEIDNHHKWPKVNMEISRWATN